MLQPTAPGPNSVELAYKSRLMLAELAMAGAFKL